MSFFSDIADGITGHSPNAESVANLNNAQAAVLQAQAQALSNQKSSGGSSSTIIIAVVVLIIILALVAVFIKMKKK